MPFGYTGNFPNQQLKNSGIFSPEDVLNLNAVGEYGGSKKLLQEQDISSTVAQIDFTNIQGDQYDVHFLSVENITCVGDGQIMRLRFSDDGGSSFEVANYEYARQYGNSSGTFGESRNTTYDNIELSVNVGASTSEAGNVYCYLYNLNNSGKYSFLTQHSVGLNATPQLLMHFGTGVYKVASKIDAIRLIMSSGNIDTAKCMLYGIKEL